MYAKVMPNQFRVKDDSIIHTPTGAEFTQVAAESMVVWTGDIGRALPDGAVYCYADVLAMTKPVWRETAFDS